MAIQLPSASKRSVGKTLAEIVTAHVSRVDAVYKTQIEKLNAALVLGEPVPDESYKYELEIANGNLNEKIREVIDGEAFTFEEVWTYLEPLDDYETSKVVDKLDADQLWDGLTTGAIVERLDDDTIKEYLTRNGGKGETITISGLNLRTSALLQEFVETHIYPNCSDQESFLFAV